jgi:hypothetical protein
VATGVLIFDGMKLGIRAGDLQFSLDGSSPENNRAILSTSFGVVPVWLSTARAALKQSEVASEAIKSSWSDDGASNKRLLIAELGPSMSVFVCCAIAVDALYDQLRPLAKLPDDLVQKWREKRTSRPKQISEVIRRVFRIPKAEASTISEALAWMFRARDNAVHPSSELKPACVRPDLPVAVDWKFAFYTCENAKVCYSNSMNLLSLLSEKSTHNKAVASELTGIVNALEEFGLIRRTSVSSTG